MGEVFLAEHPVIRSRVAIKVLHPRFLTDANVVKRFIDEARAVNTISHPGIVRIHDCRRLEEVGVYLVMELLEGESLLDKLRREGRQTPRFTARLIQQVGSALVIAHKAGIVHRDLKPANIFLVPDEDLPGGVRAKVLDFGVAKLKHDPALDEGSTVTGAVFGSPRYMSPEQCLDTKNVDARSDVYSLGAIAYEMLTERAPYEAETLGKLVLQHQTTKATRLNRLNFKVPPELSDLIMTAVACKPDDRVSDMRELRNRVATLRWVDEYSLTNVPASEESQATWEFELRDEDFDDTDGTPKLPPERPKRAVDKLKELASQDPDAPETQDLGPTPKSDELEEEEEPSREIITTPPAPTPDQEPDQEADLDEAADDEPAGEPEPDTEHEQEQKSEPVASSQELDPPEAPPEPKKPASDPALRKEGSWIVRLRRASRKKARETGEGGRPAATGTHRATPKAPSALSRTLQRTQRPTLLVLAAISMLIGGGRILGAAMDAPRVAHLESRKSPSLRGCMGIPSMKTFAPIAPLAPAADKKGRKGRKGRKARLPAVGRATAVPVVEGCYQSSELLFLSLAKALPGETTPKALALIRALLLLIAAGLFTMLLGRWSARAALANALLFAGVITDPASLLWLGSFHLEFGHVLFLYMALTLAIVVTQYSDNIGWHVLLAASLGMLGMLHVHHRFLPVILGVLIFLLLAGTHQRKAGRALVIYMIVAIGVLVVQGRALDREGPEKHQARAGATSVVLGAVLDAFDDKAEGTERLGFSPNCTPHAGVDGHALDLRTHHPCPDVQHMQRGKVTGTLISYPKVAWRVLDRGLAHARPWVTGQLSGSGGARPPWGLSAILEALPEFLFRLLILVMFVVCVVTVGRVLLSVLMGADPMGGLGVAILLCAAAGMEVFIFSLFSEGYIDLDRHTHVMATTLMASTALGVVALVREIMQRMKPPPY